MAAHDAKRQSEVTDDGRSSVSEVVQAHGHQGVGEGAHLARATAEVTALG